jgi:predicted nuclease of predicted toxin-antitoxin system
MGAAGSRSKKRSAASSKSKPREPLVFFVDRSLGKKRIAEALRAADTLAHVHDDFFAPGAPDVEWLQRAGRHGWIVLTKDRSIRWRAVECAALMNAGVRAFTLTSGNLQGADMAETFVRAVPAIYRFVADHQGPFIATVAKTVGSPRC